MLIPTGKACPHVDKGKASSPQPWHCGCGGLCVGTSWNLKAPIYRPPPPFRWVRGTQYPSSFTKKMSIVKTHTQFLTSPFTASHLAYRQMTARWELARSDVSQWQIWYHVMAVTNHSRSQWQLYTMDRIHNAIYCVRLCCLQRLVYRDDMVQTGPITVHLYHVISYGQSQLITIVNTEWMHYIQKKMVAYNSEIHCYRQS